MKTLQAAASKQLLTPQEAAAFLTTTPGTLQIWRTTGRYSLPFVKLGGCVRYRREDLETFLRARTVDPTADPKAKLRASLDMRSRERISHKRARRHARS
jgi:excisionase family DNA binding protein